jgi:hypothetical protein
LHKVQVKFIHAYLPEAKKAYNLKTDHQPVLDIHGIASKAEVYNIGSSPKTIEQGLTDGMQLIKYLTADGFIIDTPLFKLKLRVPGEYDGSESRLPGEVHPVARLQTSASFRKYLKEKVKVEFGGIDQSDGLIAEAYDEASEIIDESATIGNLLTIRGYGLKIAGESETGLYFEPSDGPSTKAAIIAVNEPKTLKVIVPALEPGKAYALKVVTQSSTKHGSGLLKTARELRSEFTVTAM